LIRVRIDLSCFGDVPSVRAWAGYRLDQGGNGALDSIDRAPNAGWTPRLFVLF
jgi:hypothetical protein